MTTEDSFKWFVEGMLLVSRISQIDKLKRNILIINLQAGVGILGIFGDLVAIFVFSCKKFQRQFYNLLIILAICDVIYLVMSIMLFALPTLFPSVTVKDIS